MAATYNELLLTDLDTARALIGDTNTDDPLHSDEHITAVITRQGDLALAIAWLADELIVRFGQDPVKTSLSGISVDFSARIPAWQALANRMRSDGLSPQSLTTTPLPTLFTLAAGRRAYRR